MAFERSDAEALHDMVVRVTAGALLCAHDILLERGKKRGQDWWGKDVGSAL